MDTRTIKALENSITHWENIAYNGAIHTASSNTCALCFIYFSNECEGCPIAIKWNKYCKKTPFFDWIHYQIKNDKLNDKKEFQVFDGESKNIAVNITTELQKLLLDNG